MQVYFDPASARTSGDRPAEWRPVQVVSISSQAVGVRSICMQDPGGLELPSWEAGAHVDVRLGNGLIRQYSLCGDPVNRSSYRIAVLREPRGRGGSQWVHDQLDVGSRIEVSTPKNFFPLIAAERYRLVAGGIGITPILAMAVELDRRGTDWRLLYGGKTRASMAFLGEIERFGHRVEVCPEDETGLLDIAGFLQTPSSSTAVYCCGPVPLLAVARNYCATHGEGHFLMERFVQDDEGGAGRNGSASFVVECARSGREFDVPEGQSILEVLTANGIVAPSLCREGYCGTCETRVLGGTPDHRDSILDEDERAEGDTMMICVSRSISDRLVIDR